MTFTQTYQLPFAVEQVYAAWVSSNTVIPPATAMDILPEVGGHYRLLIETPEFLGKSEGVFLLVQANAHLQYTWEWDHDGEVTEVDVQFSSLNDKTLVTIKHSGFSTQHSQDIHARGWDSYIEGFTAFLDSVK